MYNECEFVIAYYDEKDVLKLSKIKVLPNNGPGPDCLKPARPIGSSTQPTTVNWR